nr:FKBP-type peptidyl-prolyl cis-trans isomerase [uncultured Pedobacter sp.]
MTKINHLLLFICMAGCLVACKKDFPEDDRDPYAQLAIDTVAIRAFIIKNNINAQKDSETGIFYQIIERGTGNITYQDTTNITANYTGRLLDGTEFDTKTGAKFKLSEAIYGWQVGIKQVQKGGKVRILIPSIYGFGNIQNGPIPANSILDFTMEITDLK